MPDVFYRPIPDPFQPEAEGLISPVRCSHCGKVYDLTAVEVRTRFADCTTYFTPCCGRTADDRQYKGLPDFTRLRKR
jgi:hypothetical protein